MAAREPPDVCLPQWGRRTEGNITLYLERELMCICKRLLVFNYFAVGAVPGVKVVGMAGIYQKFFMRKELADAFLEHCEATGKAKNAVAVEAMEMYLRVNERIEPKPPMGDDGMPMSDSKRKEWIERWKRAHIPGYAKRVRNAERG